MSPTEWSTILARLRRARLLAGEDPRAPGHLDTHPLVREYFGEQLRSQRTEACKECNRRLFYYYQANAPQLPDTFRDMESLFLAVICGCNAGLFRESLHEVYIPRIQRGNAFFAANVLGARGALLSVLVHFFEHQRWGSLAETRVERQSLTAEDQLFILMQAGLLLTATRGFGAPEALVCNERAERLCHSLNRPLLLYVALVGHWRYSLVTDKLTAYLADRSFEALEAMSEAEALVERSEERWCSAELHRLRGVFLAALGAEEVKIEASFGAARRIAKQQKSISLMKRADASYAEYRRQKASGSRGGGRRLPLC